MNFRPSMKICLLSGVCTLVLLVLSGCQQKETPGVYRSGSVSWADSVFESLSLESKVAQMIMIDFDNPGDISDQDDRDSFTQKTLNGRVGGLVLFAGDPVKYAPWIEWSQANAALPQLVAIDAEWGVGFRLEGMTRFPNAMAIAASGSPELAYQVGAETARQARTVRISVLFAPVADVLTNPMNPVIGTRAWSDDPDSVATYSKAFAKGVRDGGLLAVAKHFPGHGDTFEDSHFKLPVSERSETAFFDVDLKPFRALIADSLDAIMTAHILPKGHSFSDSVPSTLSKRVMRDLLRDSLHFEGLIFSDALNMNGVTLLGEPGEIAVRAVLAGVDVLLMPPDPMEAYEAVVAAVKSGEIDQARIDSSALRILRAKEKLQLNRRTGFTDLNAVLDVVTSRESQDAGWFAARKGVTLLKNDGGLPLTDPSESVLLISSDFRKYADPDMQPAKQLLDAMASRAPDRTSLHVLDPRAWRKSLASLRLQTQGKTSVVFADFIGSIPVNGWDRLEFLSELVKMNDSVVVVEHGSPFAAINTPIDVAGHIVAYDASPGMISAVADVLFGLSATSGRLPVHISPAYPRGFGIKIPQSFASRSSAEAASMDQYRLDQIDTVLRNAVSEKAFPAAAVVVGRGSNIVKRTDYGQLTYGQSRRLNEHDVFDLASMTKVVATTTAIMQLYESGLIDLHRPVADYLPEFGINGKGSVTIWDLLTHTGGLIPFIPFYTVGIFKADEVRSRILGDSLTYEPGSRSSYSDFGLITLAWMVERITGKPFRDYTRDNIFAPLSMHDTGFKEVNRGVIENAVPTEKDEYFRHRTLQGEVHDETAFTLGGTAGHAGLFSSANDLGKFAAMLANQGRVGEHYFLKPETIRRFTTKVNRHGDHTRALGWDTKSLSGYTSAGNRFGPLSFGHTGFTGTSLWVDPDSHLYVILLTNRVYPTRDNTAHVPIRPQIANIAYSALLPPLITNN